MKNKMFYIILVLVFVAGLSLLLYPTVSNAYNAWLQSKAIVEYSQQVDLMEKETYEKELAKAQDYNNRLHERVDPFGLTEELQEAYENTLNLTGQGIMGYVQIPTVDVTLPIAHGTSEKTLRDKIGHLEWSSLPVGGESTHCVISGHRGLPSAELFTNIDRLELGDKFYLHTLGQTLEYQVCHIAVVEPNDQSLLRIEEGKDLVTLVTCTPYGINSHRLLVRGIRTGVGGADTERLTLKNEITGIDVFLIVLVLLAVLAAGAFAVLLFTGKNKRKGGVQNAQKSED